MSEVFNSTADWRRKGFTLRAPPYVLLAYDPAGDGGDNDAIVMISREEHQKGLPHDPDFAVATMFRILGAQRLPPSMEFPAKLAKLLAMHRTFLKWRDKGRAHSHAFCIESNGVGWGMASAMRSSIAGAHVIPYVTVGNASEDTVAGKKVSMPRLASLDNMRILLETHHLKIDAKAPGKDMLEQEMASFVWRRAGRPEALEGQKDDLVMATAGGLWCGTKIIPPILKAVSYRRSLK